MPRRELQMNRQTTISAWAGQTRAKGVTGMKVIQKTSQKRRPTGKLTKKEQKMMKKTHKDIGWMLSPPTLPEGPGEGEGPGKGSGEHGVGG